MWVRIEPLDVLLFRESKPFSAGENLRAMGQFPPTPLPLIGALRNQMLAKLKVPIHEYTQKAKEAVAENEYEPFSKLGRPDDLGPLEMMGPFLVSEGSIYLPLPKDLLISEKFKGTTFYLHAEENNWPLQFSPPHCSLTLSSPKPALEAPEEGYLPGQYLKDYLLEDPQKLISREPIVENEPRLGIQLSSTRTAEFGQIYMVCFSRMGDQSAFLVNLKSREGNEKELLPREGFLALGGESRVAYFRIVEEEEIPSPLNQEAQEEQKESLIDLFAGKRRFKILLLTPAIFENGWLPDGVQGTGQTWEPIPGVTGTLKAAAVGKPQVVGGWDLVKRFPRPLMRAVPAGSVYYFEAGEDFDEDKAKLLIEKFHFKGLMMKEKQKASFPNLCRASGFGLAALGIWKGKEG
jgi:CRISPR-associated protein Cmr3